MFCKYFVMLVVCYNVAAQRTIDRDCNFYEEVIPPKTYYMETPEYPRPYRPGRNCRWIGECNTGFSSCRVDCQLQMPSSPNCIGDALLISRSGDESLTGAARYCGNRNISVLSTGGKVVVGLMSSPNSTGGVFRCRLKSKLAGNTPLTCRCGEIKQTRIVGGNATGEHEYSMMAGIRDINTYEVFCGGSILKVDYIITAAHCLSEEGRPRVPRDLRVLVGHRDAQRTISYQVRQFFVHPNYVQDSNYDYDVGLVQTITMMAFNDNVLPVCLPYLIATQNLVGEKVVVTGRGLTGPGRPPSDILQEVELNVVSSNVCQQSYPDIQINARRICTFAEGKDSCQMDSGGPLLLSRGGHWFLVGLVSFGVDCAPPIPSVNTRVVPYLNWITKTIGQRGICVKRPNSP